MNSTFQQSKQRKIIYFIIGLFVLNIFGMIPLGVIGAYTAEPVTVTSSKTLEDGTVEEFTHKIYYHEKLFGGIQNHIYESLRYSLPVTLIGYFLITPPDFSYVNLGIFTWILSLISIPFIIKYTSNFSILKRFIFVYLVVIQISGMWAFSHTNFECISFIDYPIRPGPPCGI